MNYSIPKLYKPKNGAWYVHYRFKDPATGEWKQFKNKEGINRLKTNKEKLRKGAVMVAAITQELKDGFSPFDQPEAMPEYNQDFYWWFEERLKYTKAKYGLYIWKNMNNVYNKLKKFSPTLTINQLTYKFLKEFEAHLLGPEHKNHINTVTDNLIRVRTVVNDIVRSGAMEYHKNPFLKFKFETKERDKARIPYTDIKKLEIKKIENENIDQARDMYILSFNLGGIRFGDICRLENNWFSETHLTYTMHKSDKKRYIKLNDSAKRIVKKYRSKDKYLFDTKVNWGEEEKSIDARNTLYCKWLKDACDIAEVKKITFHSARHSFADHAKKTGLDVHTIKELLGHSKVATTERYMKSFYQEETDQAMDKLFAK